MRCRPKPILSTVNVYFRAICIVTGETQCCTNSDTNTITFVYFIVRDVDTLMELRTYSTTDYFPRCTTAQVSHATCLACLGQTHLPVYCLTGSWVSGSFFALVIPVTSSFKLLAAKMIKTK